MKMMFNQSSMIIIILITLILMLNFCSKKTFYDREKNSPFECGFTPKNLTRMPFSLHFFFIAVMFVIFDVELTLLLPVILIFKTSNMLNFSITFNIFITILIFGLLHEQNQGSLNWMK
uniref:NADH-ubiquinone oxidoreductase chain 3 n=1 Tax=Kyklioacalles sp. BMNH 1043787 TaxID=2834675 RepID=A0A8F5A1H6_9CUCU|nr:NADH dehydrogenase subunit 3 [Kyklioacalles sp. BMNH 1043787]